MKWISSLEGYLIQVQHIVCFEREDEIIRAYTVDDDNFVIFEGHTEEEAQIYFDKLTKALDD